MKKNIYFFDIPNNNKLEDSNKKIGIRQTKRYQYYILNKKKKKNIFNKYKRWMKIVATQFFTYIFDNFLEKKSKQ